VIKEHGADTGDEACGAADAVALDGEFELGLDLEHAAKSSNAATVRNRAVMETEFGEKLERFEAIRPVDFIGFVTIVPGHSNRRSCTNSKQNVRGSSRRILRDVALAPDSGCDND
jgi:hypothetical protein